MLVVQNRSEVCVISISCSEVRFNEKYVLFKMHFITASPMIFKFDFVIAASVLKLLRICAQILSDESPVILLNFSFAHVISDLTSAMHFSSKSANLRSDTDCLIEPLLIKLSLAPVCWDPSSSVVFESSQQ